MYCSKLILGFFDFVNVHVRMCYQDVQFGVTSTHPLLWFIRRELVLFLTGLPVCTPSLDGFRRSVHGSRPQEKDWAWQSPAIPTVNHVCLQGIACIFLCREPFCMVRAASSHVSGTCVWDAGLGISGVREGGREGGLQHSDTFSWWCRLSLSLSFRLCRGMEIVSQLLVYLTYVYQLPVYMYFVYRI